MSRKRVIICCLFISILIVTGIVLSPSLRNGFTNWDDSAYVVKNSGLKDQSPAGIMNICSSLYAGNYHPLTMLSYSFDYRFFKLNPWGYHFTNLILHLINCALIFWFIFLLSNNFLATFVATIFFAIHPLRVESVAWISARKDLLYSLFFLASLISYIYYLRKYKKIHYYFSFVAFIFSLLSKIMAITLPFVLMLIDYLVKRKIDKRAIAEKAPFLELSFLFLLIGIVGQQVSRSVFNIPFFNSCAIAIESLAFYLAKILVPIKLSCLYPYPNTGEIFNFQRLIFSLAVVISAAVLVIFSMRYNRKVVFGVFFFLVTIFPVLQIIPFGNAAVADRYTYLTSIGLFYLLGEGTRWLYLRIKDYGRIVKLISYMIIINLIVVLSFLSWNRCKVWNNSLLLWNDALQKYSNLPVAYYNRGNVYLAQGNYERAIEDYDRAVQLAPSYELAYFARAHAYYNKGDYKKYSFFYKQYLDKILAK